MKAITQVLGVSGKIIIVLGVVRSITQEKWEAALLGIILIYCMMIFERLQKH